MEKNSVIKILEKIIGVCQATNDELYLEGGLRDNTSAKVAQIQPIVGRLSDIVPENIYVVYQDFFDSFAQLSDKCSKTLELQNNLQVFRESMLLFVECLQEIISAVEDMYRECLCCGYEGAFISSDVGELICPNCKSNMFDREVIKFFEYGNLKEAKEGFTVINLSHSECVHNWMSCFCPQVNYVVGDINDIEVADSDVIVSSELVEQKEFYTHQLVYDDGFSIFVLTKKEQDDFDFSWKYTLDTELCENGPLVTVILPCYNHEQFVEEAIKSVINQSYKNIEFLVADDGSKDRTPEIMKKYEKYYSKSIYFKTNARGRDLELKEYATGKYVALMHSDDIWHKDKIALQVEYMEKHPECASCLTWCRNVNQYGNYLPDQLFIQPNRSREEWMRFFWESGNALCNPSSLTRRELFYNKVWQGFTSRQLPDYFKWIDMIQHHPIHIITKELTFMRRYQMEEVENTSIESNENTINLHVEMGINWPFCLRDMEDEFFIKTFGQYFIKKDAESKEELMCEKYFLLVNHESPFIQNGGLVFYNDLYIHIKECLKDKYDYGFNEYISDARTKGIMGFLKGKIY